MTPRLPGPAAKQFRRRHGRIAAAAMLVAVVALAGCGGGADTGKAPNVAETAAIAPKPLAAPTQAVETVAALLPPRPEQRYPPPEALTDLDADRLADLLGPPRLKRRDDPAEIWHYRGEACALDVFLYRSGDVYRVRHFETRGPGRAPVDRKDCFESLLKARDRARAG